MGTLKRAPAQDPGVLKSRGAAIPTPSAQTENLLNTTQSRKDAKTQSYSLWSRTSSLGTTMMRFSRQQPVRDFYPNIVFIFAP